MRKNNPFPMGVKVRLLLAETGKSQTWLAKKVGATNAAISASLKRRSRSSIYSERIAAEFGVNHKWLVDDVGSKFLDKRNGTSADTVSASKNAGERPKERTPEEVAMDVARRKMSHRLAVAAVLLFALLGTEASAADESPDQCKARLGGYLECFESQAFFGFTLCRVQIRMALMTGAVGNPCASEQRRAIEPFYSATAKQFAKRPAALSMLKETYAYWQTSLDGLSPQEGERQIVYEQRIGRREERLKDRMNRLRIEK